jgi:hypothetical protein
MWRFIRDLSPKYKLRVIRASNFLGDGRPQPFPGVLRPLEVLVTLVGYLMFICVLYATAGVLAWSLRTWASVFMAARYRRLTLSCSFPIWRR